MRDCGSAGETKSVEDDAAMRMVGFCSAAVMVRRRWELMNSGFEIKAFHSLQTLRKRRIDFTGSRVRISITKSSGSIVSNRRRLVLGFFDFVEL